MTDIKFNDFKNWCYHVETMLERSWVITEFSGENYPKTFYYAKFVIGDASKKQILLICNKTRPIFAFVDPSKVETFDYFKYGFVHNEHLAAALATTMKSSQVPYAMLRPEVLLLEFNGKTDFTEKFKTLSLIEPDISLLIQSLRPDLFNYKLFHGYNIGLDLFNSEDD